MEDRSFGEKNRYRIYIRITLEDYRLNGKTIDLEGRNLNPNKWCKM